MMKCRVGVGFLLVISALVLVSGASASQITGTVSFPGPTSYWNIHIDSGSGILTPGDYNGYCADSNTPLNVGQHTFNVYSSLGYDHVPAITSAEWGKINWILNHPELVTSWLTVQAAIWHFDGQDMAEFPDDDTMPSDSYPHQEYTDLIAAANAHGDFVPDCGEKYAAIILNVSASGQESGQAVFIEATRTTCPGEDPGIPSGIPAPEFPSVALPAAMIISMAGLVYFLKKP